jgi:hypothetical protein
MGTKGTGGEGANPCAESSESGHWKPPKGWGAALGSLFTLAAVTISVIYRGSVLGTAALTEIAHWLFLGLAIGWVSRSTIHAIIGYFRRSEVEGVGPYTLPLVSAVNAVFAIAWLCAAIFVATDKSGPAATALATAIACLVSFLLALVTHRAAQKAKRPRASEKVRAKLRDPLDPGFSTPIGWPLVKLIDCPSPTHLLSTYVAGSLALLLLVLVLTASAAVSNSARHDSQARIEKTVATQPEGSQSSDGIIADALPHGLSPTPAGLHVGATQKAVDLLCLPIQLSASLPPSQRSAPPMTFFCIIVANDQLTSQFLILAPSSLP